VKNGRNVLDPTVFFWNDERPSVARGVARSPLATCCPLARVDPPVRNVTVAAAAVMASDRAENGHRTLAAAAAAAAAYS